MLIAAAMHRVFVLVVLLAGCPDDDESPNYDHVYECPKLEGAVQAAGTDRSATHYIDGISSMVPGSTQLITLGTWHEKPYGVDWTGRFDIDVLGADGIDVVRVTDNQFLLRASDEGSACLKIFDPDHPDDAQTYGLYSMHPLRMNFRPNPDWAPWEPDEFVYAWGARVTLHMQSGGGHDIVDSGLRFAMGERMSQSAWDTVRVYETGLVPIDVITSDGKTTHFELEVVSAPDEVIISGDEVPVALAAGQSRSICVYGRNQGRIVGGLEWTFAVTNANWTTNEGSGFGGFYSGCVQVRPTTPGQRVEIKAMANGSIERVFAFDVI